MLACGRMMALGDHAKAKHCLELTAAADPQPRSAYKEILDVFDDAAAARALIRDYAEKVQPSALPRLHGFAPFAAYFEDDELCVSIYRRFARHMIGIYVVRLWHPLYSKVRKLPAFKELVRELNLVTYWRTTGAWGEYTRPVGQDDFECW